MTYYGGKNLANSYRTVRKNTIAIAEEIPAEQYSFRASPETMTVGEMLGHLAAAYQWQREVHSTHRASIDFAFFTAHREKAQAEEKDLAAKGKDAILQALKDRGEAFASFLESLDEPTLGEMVTFTDPLPAKSRFEMLLGVKEHEMHHRGQLMLMQRMLGLVPPLTRARQQMTAAAR